MDGLLIAHTALYRGSATPPFRRECQTSPKSRADRKTFERIELRASGESRPVALDVEARLNINQQLSKKPSASTTAEEEALELRGTLRAVHLDKDWLEIAVDGIATHVEGLQDTVDDVIGPMVNRTVMVKATRVSERRLQFVDIELVE